MIQFRWEKLDAHYPAEEGWNIVIVDGHPCILQYRLHFIPTTEFIPGVGDIVAMKSARDVDSQWKNVVIGHE